MDNESPDSVTGDTLEPRYSYDSYLRIEDLNLVLTAEFNTTPCTFRRAVKGPLVVPLRLDVQVVVLAVRGVGGGVGRAVLVDRQLAV